MFNKRDGLCSKFPCELRLPCPLGRDPRSRLLGFGDKTLPQILERGSFLLVLRSTVCPVLLACQHSRSRGGIGCSNISDLTESLRGHDGYSRLQCP
ncbi:MAG: hypothetical protein D084_Lepto4C00169G0001 [Leptospirillum sp. Group IV 'UBA BS']|nr:MAG: hypothetical protein D084_Lepto4C00169G0001 [Leptospirillum sp. Group IV 'UBA BS']